MRVAMVAMETSHHRDAAGRRRFERVARYLAAAGHDVTVYCSRFWEGHDRVTESEGVTYRSLAADPAPPTFDARLPAALARARPDVVHATPSPASAVLAAALGARFARAPLVVEWYGDESVPSTALGRQVARRPARIVTPSELVRTRVRERGATEANTTVIPESIDFETVESTEPEDRIEVAFGHHLDEDANVENLLLGLAELREKGWSATIVGDGPHREAYERQASDLRIDDRVTFVGDVDRERRVAIYRAAHVFVQTARREWFPTELLWALACGCVGVVEYQASSSAHELIEQRDRSYRVTSTQQMADAVADSGEYEYRTIDEEFARFDHETVRGEYEDLYERLREGRGLF